MDDAFRQRQVAAVRSTLAGTLGCSPETFAREELTIVDRPDATPWHIALVVTFGLGTVLSIERSYREFAEGLPLEAHYAATGSTFLSAIVEEARRRGQPATAGVPELIWALSSMPPEPPVPDDLELRRVDASWMADEQSHGRFENGVGEPEVDQRAERNQFGIVLFDRAGEPVAVGGVFLTSGLPEVGVDVVRPQRGRGLGALVVAAAARAVLDDHGVPWYWCEPTNIRSQRTAMTAGFVPVASVAPVNYAGG